VTRASKARVAGGLASHLGLVAALVACVCPAAAQATSAAARFSAPRVLDRSLQARQPRVAATESGELIATWIRQGRVFAIRRLPGGGVLRQQLWSGGRRSGAAQDLLVAAPDGSAIVAWSAGGRMYVDTRRAGHGFARVAPGGANRIAAMTVAIDSAGGAVVAWEQASSGRRPGAIRLARCSTVASRCTAPVTLASSGLQPRAGIDDGGVATVAWISDRAVIARDVPPRGGAAPLQRWRTAGGVSGIHVSVAPDGATTIGWGAEAPSGDRIARAVYRPGGGRFSKPFTLGGDLVGFSPLTTAPIGGSWWAFFTGLGGTPLARYQGPTRVVQDATSNVESGPIDNLALSGDLGGAAAAAWETDSTVNVALAAPGATSANAARVGPTRGLSPSIGAFPQVAISSRVVAVVWLERPPFDPLDVSRSGSGRVVLATAARSQG